MQRVDLLRAAGPERDVVVAAARRHPHEGLRHEAGDDAVLARDLGADLAIGGEPVGGPERVVVGEVELELAGRVLVVALDHVETHGLTVLDHLHEDRPELFELVDVVAVGLGHAAVGAAVRAALEPHHFGLGAVAHLHPVLGLELVVNDAQVAAAVRRQVPARVLALLAIAEAGAEDARHALVPRQLHEGLGIGDADQLRGFRPVADVVGMAVGEEVGRRAVHQLETPLCDLLPVIGWHALADNPPGDGDELIVDIGDAELLDLGAHLAHQFVSAFAPHMGFKIGHLRILPDDRRVSSAPREGAVGDRVKAALRKA